VVQQTHEVEKEQNPSMVFKKMLQKIGVGGPSVDTVLTDPRVQPGGQLSGEVRLTGGEADSEIEHIALSLVVRSARSGSAEFHRAVVCGATRLTAKEQRVVSFTIPMPWETPLTEVGGQPLPGIVLGLRTELSIAKAVDKGDLDPVIVTPLASQDAVLDAFGERGFQFKSTELEAGQLYGVRQELPFYQETEFHPPARYAGRIAEVELSFVADREGVQVVLVADKRGGFGGSPVGRFGVGHDEAVDTDWARLLGEWLDEVANSRQAHHGYGHHDGYDDDEYGHRGQRRGMGMGGVVAGAAVGVVGGMMIGEMLDGDDDGGDEG
jgi:sporulation-control protein